MKIKTTISVILGSIRFSFINKIFVKIVKEKLEIEFYLLIKQKLIKGLDDKTTRLLIYAIHLALFIKNYT